MHQCTRAPVHQLFKSAQERIDNSTPVIFFWCSGDWCSGALKEMNKSKGLTLIEILVATSILTLVLVVGFGALQVYNVSVTMASIRSNLSAQANIALTKMAAEMLRSGGSHINFVDGNAADSLVPDDVTFQIAQAIDDDGNVEWGDGVTERNSIRYSVDPSGNTYAFFIGSAGAKNNQLIKEIKDTGDVTVEVLVLANEITNLQFTPMPFNLATDKKIKISITAAKDGVSVTMETDVDFKN